MSLLAVSEANGSWLMAMKMGSLREAAAPVTIRGMVGRVTETPRGDGMGWGLTVGIRFTTTLSYDSEAESLKAREKLVEALRGAEVLERWARR